MPDHPEIYRSQAWKYEALVSREDYQRNLLPAIEKIIPLQDCDVIEMGAGTGRLTCQLAPKVRSIRAFDISQHMLEIAIGKLKQTNLTNWQAQTADHRGLPVDDHSADLVISGWSVCYIVVDHPQDWRSELEKVLVEIRRVLRPSGKTILIETLGTGFTQPTPPDHLVEYYAWLKENGFQSTWIRTDYRFESLEIARELSEFFFGKEMNQKILQDSNGITLPECTGIWWK